jgi:hypothetical protein
LGRPTDGVLKEIVVIAISLAAWRMRAGHAGRSRALALAGLVAIGTHLGAAQSAPSRPSATAAPTKAAPPPSAPDSLVISVITMGPGPEIFERFGHISIRVHDLRTGIDTSYNWGMFDFEQPHFLQRFLTGDTRYWMQGWPTGPLVSAYRQAHRWVTEQEIALTPVQADSLRRYIEWFARAYGDRFTRFCALRKRMDPDGLFGNDQARRLGLV